MPQITSPTEAQTVITSFEVSPGTAQDLMDKLVATYKAFIRHQPGFIGAGLHINDAQTRIANSSQWARREDFLAMLRLDEMRAYNREFQALCRSFEPVLYDVVHVTEGGVVGS